MTNYRVDLVYFTGFPIDAEIPRTGNGRRSACLLLIHSYVVSSYYLQKLLLLHSNGTGLIPVSATRIVMLNKSFWCPRVQKVC